MWIQRGASQTAAIFLSLAGLLTACNQAVSVNGASDQTSLPDPMSSATPAPPSDTLSDSDKAIFADNFDSQPDWQPQPASGDASPAGASAGCSSLGVGCSPLPPMAWSDFRSTGMWWSPALPAFPAFNDTLSISTQAGRGGSGKAFVVSNEANIGTSGDGWGADGQLLKILDQDYPELYVRAWIYYQPGWKWNLLNDMMIKTLRVQHYSGSGDPFSNFSSGSNAPIFLYLFKHSNTYGTREMLDYRCGPAATNYYCSPSYTYDHDAYFLPSQGSTTVPTSPGEPADLNWHSYELHVKMNSYTNGAFNSDGVSDLWFDGMLLDHRTNIKWLSAGVAPGTGWNSVSFGGNAYNFYNDTWSSARAYAVNDTVVRNSHAFTCIQSNTNQPPVFGASAYWIDNGFISGQIEQWYGIDDVVISSHYSGPPPAPVSVSVQKANSTTAKVSWAAGSNGATFSLKGYRVYYGTSLDSLIHVAQAGTATTVDISGLQSGQTYYFAVTGYNQAAYDSNENESLKSTSVSILMN